MATVPPSPATLEAAHADAIAALKRLGRLASARYQSLEGVESAAADEVRVEMFAAESALLVLRASHHDAGAITMLRALVRT